jgi:hypothetical protein
MINLIAKTFTLTKVSKLIAILVLLSFAPFSLLAFDFGLSVDSISGIDLPVDGDFSDSFTQRIKAALWAETGWTAANGNDFTISGQGIYVFTDSRPYLFDIERLVFQMRLPELFSGVAIGSGSFGRFRYTDPTGYILNHPIDGARFSLDFRGVEVSLGVGYTGLLLRPDGGIEMSDADQGEGSELFSPKRVFQGLDFVFSELIPRQRLALGVFSQQDLRGSDQLHSIYGYASLSGPLAQGFFYSAQSAVSWDFESDSPGLLAELTSTYFLPEYAFSRFGFGLLLTNEEFIPLSKASLGTLHGPRLEGTSRVLFSYGFRPWGNYYNPVLRNLGFELDWKTFFNSTIANRYDGTELTATANFRPTSDFGTSLMTGIYFPPGGFSPVGKLQLLVSIGF